MQQRWTPLASISSRTSRRCPGREPPTLQFAPVRPQPGFIQTRWVSAAESGGCQEHLPVAGRARCQPRLSPPTPSGQRTTCSGGGCHSPEAPAIWTRTQPSRSVLATAASGQRTGGPVGVVMSKGWRRGQEDSATSEAGVVWQQAPWGGRREREGV